jgi:hypothetical protein
MLVAPGTSAAMDTRVSIAPVLRVMTDARVRTRKERLKVADDDRHQPDGRDDLDIVGLGRDDKGRLAVVGRDEHGEGGHVGWALKESLSEGTSARASGRRKRGKEGASRRDDGRRRTSSTWPPRKNVPSERAKRPSWRPSRGRALTTPNLNVMSASLLRSASL